MERYHHRVPNRPCSINVLHILGKDENADRYRAWAPNMEDVIAVGAVPVLNTVNT